MTMPTLIAGYKKQETLTRLQKAYSVINQAMRRSEVDNGEYAEWETGLPPTEYLEKYWLPYFVKPQICNTAFECGYSSEPSWARYNGNDEYTSFIHYRVPFLTGDNILYSVSVGGGIAGESQYVVIIDINGSKRPNMFGEDVFMFTRLQAGDVRPLGYDKTDDEINADCTKAGMCKYCAAKIMKAGWHIEDDYLL